MALRADLGTYWQVAPDLERGGGYGYCAHTGQVAATGPATGTCAACDALGEAPAQLRICLTCGAVGCSDGAPFHHARTHYETTGHPLAADGAPGGHSGWCYVDGLVILDDPDFRQQPRGSY